LWFWIVVAIILVPGVLLSLILAIPIDAVLDMDVHGKPVLKTKVRWLFGLVTFQPGGEKAAEKPVRPVERKQKPARKTGLTEVWERFMSVLEALKTKGLLNEVKKLLLRLFRSFDVRELAGEFTAGLPDPAYTGMLYGLFTAATVLFGWPLLRNVRLYPAFDRFVFEGDLHAVIRVKPISLVWSVLSFMFSLPVMRAVKKMVVTEWKRRKSRQRANYPSAA
jgi:hypothetical protein